jgi:glutamine synthetase type III
MPKFPVEEHTNSVAAVEQAMKQWLEKNKEAAGTAEAGALTLTYNLEIELYLIDLYLYRARPDLVLCGRTLQGLSPGKNLFPQTPGYSGIPSRAQVFLEEVQEEANKQGVSINFRAKEEIPTQFAVEFAVQEAAKAPEYRQKVLDILMHVVSDHDLKVLLHPQPFAGFPASAQYCRWNFETNKGPLTTPVRFPLQCTGTLLHFNTLATRLIEKHTGTLAQLQASLDAAANTLHCAASEDVPAQVQAYREETYARQLERELNTLSELTINHFVSAAVKHVNLILENIRGLKEVLPPEEYNQAASTQFKVVSITMNYVNELRLLIHDVLEALKDPNRAKEEGPQLMEEVRKRIDHLEMIVDQEFWPVPTYRDLLYLD